jgi:hypothetical protein
MSPISHCPDPPLLQAGAPALLLAAVAAHPGSPRVIGGAVGALLALVLHHPALAAILPTKLNISLTRVRGV